MSELGVLIGDMIGQATKGTKITLSSTCATHLPSAATASIVTFSRMGNGFLFLLTTSIAVYGLGCPTWSPWPEGYGNSIKG